MRSEMLARSARICRREIIRGDTFARPYAYASLARALSRSLVVTRRQPFDRCLKLKFLFFSNNKEDCVVRYSGVRFVSKLQVRVSVQHSNVTCEGDGQGEFIHNKTRPCTHNHPPIPTHGAGSIDITPALSIACNRLERVGLQQYSVVVLAQLHSSPGLSTLANVRSLSFTSTIRSRNRPGRQSRCIEALLFLPRIHGQILNSSMQAAVPNTAVCDGLFLS